MRNWKVAIGSLSSWSGWVITITLLIRLLVAMVSDPNRTQNYSPLWLVIWLIGVIAIATVVLTVMLLGFKEKLKTKPRPFGNVILIGIAGAIGNGVVGITALSWGLDTDPLWHVRLGGGALAAILEFTLINFLRSSLTARRESIRKLTEVENQLLGYRDSAKQIIEDEIENLKEKTKATLLPSINRIQKLIEEKSNTRSALIDELKVLINEEVRPLSKAVLQEADTLEKVQPLESKVNQYRPVWQTKYRIANSIRPGLAMTLYAMIFPMIEFIAVDHRSAFRGLLGGLSAGIVLYIIKAIIPKKLEVKTNIGITLTVLISVVSILPSFYYMWQEYGPIYEIFNSILFQLMVAILGSFLLSYTKAIDINNERYEIALSQNTAELAKEVALFEQKLFLEKRAWSRILHGEVQSALTAAATRLQRSENLEPYEVELIRQDLRRAIENLSNPVKPKTNFNQTLTEIVNTWQQICQITTEISARAQRALENSEDTKNATLEIIKEAVSNAVRHGDAKQITIRLNRHQDDILEIEIENNGNKISPEAKKGLGSQMLDELTLTWNINQNQNTLLKAEVPIARS